MMKLHTFRTILTKETNRYSSFYEKSIHTDSIEKWFVGTIKEARSYSMKHNVVLLKTMKPSKTQVFQYVWRGTNLTNNFD